MGSRTQLNVKPVMALEQKKLRNSQTRLSYSNAYSVKKQTKKTSRNNEHQILHLK